MKNLSYDRQKAIAYARRWAMGRNPVYFNFDGIGGDCTNFVSQCIYAGAGVMNYTHVTGWYYQSANDRTPSWTGVKYLYDFLVSNRSVGPYGQLCEPIDAIAGDVIQLGRSDGTFYHSLLVVSVYPQIHVAAHSGNVLDRLLESYEYERSRCIHVEGVRSW